MLYTGNIIFREAAGNESRNYIGDFITGGSRIYAVPDWERRKLRLELALL